MKSVLLNQKHVADFVQDIDTFIFDCDGVLWHGNELIPGANETIQKLYLLGKRVLFVTNNSTKSTSQYEKKFSDLGVTIRANSIFGTAGVTALHLKNILKVTKKVYIVGNEGMKLEMEGAGMEVLGCGPDAVLNHSSSTISGMVDTTLDDQVEAVVVGFDSHFNLQKLARAMLYLQEDNMPFIATNTDPQYPMPDGRSLPGTGAIVAAVSVAAGRDPVILGKPERTMFDAICTVHDVDPSRTLMIGDRLDTDIAFGRGCGLATLCVLTGVTKEPLLDIVNKGDCARLVPDFYASDIGQLLRYL